MSRGIDCVALKITLVLLGLLIGWTAASHAFIYFIRNGVASDFATGYSIILWVCGLGAFEPIAFKVKRKKATPTPKMSHTLE